MNPLVLLLMGCNPDPEPVAEAEPAFVALEPALLLRRISLDLRGTTPSLDELERVEADATALAAVTAEILADPRHEDRLVDLFAEQWLTEVDEYNVPADDFQLEDQEYDFLRSVGDEPLRLLAHVASNDLPWTEVVTADYTMANDLLVSIWPLEYIEEDEGATWKKAQYTDGRPSNGVMATNGLWWRYDSTRNNFNRGRAAAISKLLLCHDFLERPVEFEGVTEFTTEALLDATRNNPGCVSCHSAVDPLAANLFGYYWYDDKDATEMSYYHPEREPLGVKYLDLAPSWYGSTLDGASALGPFVAQDSRFVRCAAERLARGLWRRDVEAEDHDTVSALVEAFEAGDLRVDGLITAIVATPEYQAGALAPAATALDEERAQTLRVLAVDQISSAVESVTGFRWTYNGYDQLDNDLEGYRVMVGGVDGDVVTHPSLNPSLTRTLVSKRLAQLAASFVVTHDVSGLLEERTLFSDQTADLLSLAPGDDAFDDELVHLHRRILSRTPDATQLSLATSLWSDVNALSGPQQAWTSLVSALLRDPQFWSY